MWRKLARMFLIAAYAGGVFCAFAVTFYLSFSSFVRRGVTPVPDLVGLTLEQGEGLLGDQSLRLLWLESEDRFHDSVPAGQILQHRPRAGSLVKKNSAIEVVLSRGRQLVEVPDVRGQALQAAQVNLAAAGLSLGRRSNVFSDHGRPGTVVDHHPSAGELVDRDTAVNLMISIDNRSEIYVMPDLVYLNDETVRRFFDRHGFRLGSVKYEPYEGIDAGVVLRQYPLAGHPLHRHDVISLVVAAPIDSEPGPAPTHLGGAG